MVNGYIRKKEIIIKEIIISALFIKLTTFLYKSKMETQKPEMQKNPGENITTVEVDPITGEYYVTIPEWILNDFGWYEGTEVNMEVEGDCIVITEIKKD